VQGVRAGNAPRFLWAVAGTAFLLLVWEIAARLYGAGLILPGPLPVLASLGELLQTPRFYLALRHSFVRVMWGIALAVPLGIAAGLAAGLDRRLNAFLSPLFSVISATPVISVILIAFLFLGSGRTPVFAAFLMIFPVMAATTIEGVKSADPKLKELCAAFNMSRRKTLQCLYLPALMPFILGGLRSSLSLSWKVVVAAEVMVQPLPCLCAGMQQARAHLNLLVIFAWTAAAVCAAALTQGILSLALKLRRRPGIGGGKRGVPS